MSLHAAVPWFQIPDPASCLGGAISAPLIITILIGAIAWIVARGIGAIVGEYFKRNFFPEWWDELRKTKAEFADLKRTIEAERYQYAAERHLTEQLIVENDRLLKRVLELQVEQVRTP